MEMILEPARQTPVAASCDVLVCGGGIAGAAAALAAARMGKKTILLEREFLLGGLGTLGLVTIYLPLCDGRGHQVSFGIAEELLRLSIRRGADDRYPAPWLEGGTQEERIAKRFQVRYNPWLFATDLENHLKDNGVSILYGTSVNDVRVEDGAITHVLIDNCSGRQAICTGSVVDATGDAIVAHLAGAETAVYRKGNVLSAWYYYLTQGQLKLKMFGAKDITGEREEAPLGGVRFSALDAAENSEMLIRARQEQMKDLEAFWKTTDPDMRPVTVPTIPDVRMTRRLAGLQTPDVADDHVFMPDSIGCIGSWRKAGPAFELPYGALYGNSIRNLFAAGRCISTTDAMWDLTRVIPACAVTGQAAGTAAAMTQDASSLPVSELQEALQDAGVRLHLE